MLPVCATAADISAAVAAPQCGPAFAGPVEFAWGAQHFAGQPDNGPADGGHGDACAGNTADGDAAGFPRSGADPTAAS